MVGSRARCGAESSGHCSFNRELGAPGASSSSPWSSLPGQTPPPTPGPDKLSSCLCPLPASTPKRGSLEEGRSNRGGTGPGPPAACAGMGRMWPSGRALGSLCARAWRSPPLPACPPVRPGSRLMLEAPGSSCPPLATPKLPSLLLQTRLPQEPWLRVEMPPIQSLPQPLAQSS